MHARLRSPGSGHNRPNSTGMGGLATASRISPESSMRGHGFYNSEYRNYNRGGFGRGQRRPFQPPQPPPRRGDVFMEAGRLAAEYLVSKGLLPPNGLSGKWQNGNLKNHVGDFQSARLQEGDGMPLSADARISALSRLGNVAADIAPGRRRNFDDYRRRSESFKNLGFELNRDLGRSGSRSERSRDSSDMEGDDDASLVHKEEQKVGKEDDRALQNFRPTEETPKSVNMGETESVLEKDRLIDDGNAKEKAISSYAKQILSSELSVKPTNESGDVKMSDAEGGEVKDETVANEIDQQDVKQDETDNSKIDQQGAKHDIAVEPCSEEDNQEPKNNSELLMLCRFAKVPTRTRSSLMKNAKFDQDPATEGKDSHACELPEESLAHGEHAPVDNSSTGDSSNPSSDSKDIVCDVKKAPVVAEEEGLSFHNDQGSFMSFTEKPLMQEQEGNDRLPVFGMSSSMFVERGEKRALEDDDSWDGIKKPREWAPSINTHSDAFLGLSNSMAKPETSQEFEERPGQTGLIARSMFQKGNVACIDYAEEKQLFPGSFKTCDLNLMEASEVNENHSDGDPIIVFPSITESGKQAMPVDIDLSMSNKGNASDKYGKCGSHGKDIEVIDLENDSAQEDKTFNSSDKRSEHVFTGLDGFANNPHNNNEVQDVQDGYGLMISELLGNDIPNCSSVPPDMNSLHNEIGLHDGEGILGDDDSIYMTLGEIPISFLRGWEQPTQEFGKPF